MRKYNISFMALLTIVLLSAALYRGPSEFPALKESVEISSIQKSGLPITIHDSMIRPLREMLDPVLQKKLEGIVARNKKLAMLAKNNKIGIGIVDLSDPYRPKFARVNGSNMMYAASLPKIAVLLTAMEAVESGDLEYTDALKSDLRLMIAKSNNAATTRVIDLVGFERINKVMQDPKYELYDEDHGGGLWVGKRYAQSGKRVGDPLKNISHAASATQVCRFYYLLAYGRLVNHERSKEMLSYMGEPELHHKFVNTLDKVAPKAKVFRKSGSWKNYHSDSVLVWGTSWRRYILVALVEDGDGEVIMRNLMKEVDKELMPTKIK